MVLLNALSADNFTVVIEVQISNNDDPNVPVPISARSIIPGINGAEPMDNVFNAPHNRNMELPNDLLAGSFTVVIESQDSNNDDPNVPVPMAVRSMTPLIKGAEPTDIVVNALQDENMEVCKFLLAGNFTVFIELALRNKYAPNVPVPIPVRSITPSSNGFAPVDSVVSASQLSNILLVKFLFVGNFTVVIELQEANNELLNIPEPMPVKSTSPGVRVWDPVTIVVNELHPLNIEVFKFLLTGSLTVVMDEQLSNIFVPPNGKLWVSPFRSTTPAVSACDPVVMVVNELQPENAELVIYISSGNLTVVSDSQPKNNPTP